MAKYECNLSGNFQQILADIDRGIIGGSISATLEDSSNFFFNGAFCAVRVYERYSMIGNNRVSLNITLFGDDNGSVLSAISSGGSQAVLFKMNTFGEQAFLDRVVDIVEKYRA